MTICQPKELSSNTLYQQAIYLRFKISITHSVMLKRKKKVSDGHNMNAVGVNKCKLMESMYTPFSKH